MLGCTPEEVMAEFTKTDGVLIFVLRFMRERGRTGLGAVELMKLIYFIDCAAQQFLGHTITGTTWVRQEQGHLTWEFYEARKRLLDHEIRVEIETFPDTVRKKHHHY